MGLPQGYSVGKVLFPPVLNDPGSDCTIVTLEANLYTPEGDVTWLHGDHLGSTSLATDAAGGALSRQLYYPFGQVRWESESPLPTDFTYTGQRLDATGLMFYHARYYAPQIGRFVSADTIVPEPGNPQDLNRYSYVRNNALRYTDPTGHCIFAPPWDTLACVALGISLVVTGDTVPPSHIYFESLPSNAPSDADALKDMFLTDRLGGNTVQARLVTILDLTRKIPGLYTSGGFGETGFQKQFQDGHWYEIWGGTTNQVGHFLTAVAFGYYSTQGSETELERLAVVHQHIVEKP